MILPAIDIIDGKCVRLSQGDYSKRKTYSLDPLKVAQDFEGQGAIMLHIVDLDGAKIGTPINLETIKKICEGTSLSVQVGGGIRTAKDAEKLFELGVDRIILGTSATQDSALIKRLISDYGCCRIIVSVDAKNEQILVKGWLEDSGKILKDFLIELKNLGVRNIIFTDIESDGMLKGPNMESVKKVLKSGLNVVVAGGVSSDKNLEQLAAAGPLGAIIGKALYEGQIDLAEAVAKFQINNLAKRVIPCMDVKDGRVVKGTSFRNLKDAGDPVELAKKYSEMGADELVFLDITATVEKRKTLCELVRKIASNINIPFTVGGGISSLEDTKALLDNGADKVSIGSAAVKKPNLIKEASRQFGAQCIVISVDAKKTKTGWEIFIEGGRKSTGIDAIEFSQNMQTLGAGELLVNSLDRDGRAKGYDLALLAAIKAAVDISVIASSGAGKKSDFLEAFQIAKVDAVLAASVFHYEKIAIADLKNYLQINNVKIRS